MTIHLLQATDQLPTSGIVFWRSNILRSFQLRVYTPQGEVAALHQVHPDRTSVEFAAYSLATAMALNIFEIEIEQFDLPDHPTLPAENVNISQK